MSRFNCRHNGMFVQPMQAPNLSLYGLQHKNSSKGTYQRSRIKSTPAEAKTQRGKTKKHGKPQTQRKGNKDKLTKYNQHDLDKAIYLSELECQQPKPTFHSVFQSPSPLWPTPKGNQHFQEMRSVFNSPVNNHMIPGGLASDWSLNRQPNNGTDHKFATDRYEQDLQEAILRSKCESTKPKVFATDRYEQDLQEAILRSKHESTQPKVFATDRYEQDLQEAILRSKCESTQPKVQTKFGDDKESLSSVSEESEDDDDSDDNIQSRSTTVNVNRLNGRIFEDQIEIELRRSKMITSFERQVPCHSHRRTGYADFVIKPKSGKKVVIEAKNFDGNPLQAKNVLQVYEYAKDLHAKPMLVVSNTTKMPPSEAIERLAKRKEVVIQTFDKFKEYLQD